LIENLALNKSNRLHLIVEDDAHVLVNVRTGPLAKFL